MVRFYLNLCCLVGSFLMGRWLVAYYQPLCYLPILPFMPSLMYVCMFMPSSFLWHLFRMLSLFFEISLFTGGGFLTHLSKTASDSISTQWWKFVVCVEAAVRVLEELDARFSMVVVLDALDIVYPKYWLQGDCESSFWKHLTILKEFYGESRHVTRDGKKISVSPVLDSTRLETEQPLFKMAMLANSA